MNMSIDQRKLKKIVLRIYWLGEKYGRNTRISHHGHACPK